MKKLILAFKGTNKEFKQYLEETRKQAEGK